MCTGGQIGRRILSAAAELSRRREPGGRQPQCARTAAVLQNVAVRLRTGPPRCSANPPAHGLTSGCCQHLVFRGIQENGQLLAEASCRTGSVAVPVGCCLLQTRCADKACSIRCSCCTELLLGPANLLHRFNLLIAMVIPDCACP